MVPPCEVMPNARVHWSRKAEATRLFREAAYFAALNPILARGERMPLFRGTVGADALIAWPDRVRCCDPDNALAGLKALYDGLQDTGLFGDDRALVHRPVTQIVDPDRQGYVSVTLFQEASR
jgi:hypothetical protein